MLPISSSVGEEVDASRDTANPGAIQPVGPVRRRGLGNRLEEDILGRVLVESRPGYFRYHYPTPQTGSGNTAPFIVKQRTDSNQLVSMRERVQLLEQQLCVGSSSAGPGGSSVPGLPTGGQHPAQPLEEHPRYADPVNLAWQRTLSERVLLLGPQLHMMRAGLEPGNSFTPRAPDAGPVARPWYEDHVGTQPSHELKENAAAITLAWKEGLVVRKAYVPFLTLSALTLGAILDHYLKHFKHYLI